MEIHSRKGILKKEREREVFKCGEAQKGPGKALKEAIPCPATP